MSEAEAPTPTAPSLLLKGQYIKDVSFENPRAPQSLLSLREPPGIDISVDLNAQRLQENMFELVIHIAARAIHEKNTIFLIDIDYAGIFEIKGITGEAALEQTVLVDCAYLLFPFARRVIADLTRDGGFPPLQLEPINFHVLYEQNKHSISRQAPTAAVN
jgi:preprotein translocase subunit SecB